jgi:hypothetical protein
MRRSRRVTAASLASAKLATFLRHLAESGSVSFAAWHTGIGRRTVYERRKVDSAFAEGWQNAMTMAVESLHDIVIARARDGDDHLLMLLLRTLRPEAYGRPSRG